MRRLRGIRRFIKGGERLGEIQTSLADASVSARKIGTPSVSVVPRWLVDAAVGTELKLSKSLASKPSLKPELATECMSTCSED